jgi:hypothetical protein
MPRCKAFSGLFRLSGLCGSKFHSSTRVLGIYTSPEPKKQEKPNKPDEPENYVATPLGDPASRCGEMGVFQQPARGQTILAIPGDPISFSK